MTTRVALRVHGLNLQVPATYETIPAALAELSFEATGPVTLAVAYVEHDDARAQVLTWARAIHTHMPHVTVERVHVDLVTVADIATRCTVAREAARLWATGRRRSGVRPFPEPHDIVNATTGRMIALYEWPQVLTWVRDVVGVDPEPGLDHPDCATVAALNADLADGVASGHAVGQSDLHTPTRSDAWTSIETVNSARATELLTPR